MATQSAASGSNGFFGTISSSIQSAVSSVSDAANSVLPVWTQYTLAKSKTSQLNQPTVNQAALPANLNGIGGAISANPMRAALIVAGVVIGGVLLLKLLKR